VGTTGHDPGPATFREQAVIRGGLLRGGLAAAAPLLEHPRYEVFPAGNVEDAVAEWIPAGMTVTVTASPSKGLDATLGLAERLAGRGYRVVPHLSARLVRDDAHLADIVARLTACGIDDVFVPAGDADPPVGRFDSALSLLERLAEMGSPFARTGITGYPETHPRIDDDITIQAMWDKRRLAAYIVSNLCFDPVTVRRWIRRVRARGVTLPLFVGLAGPVERARLLRMAAKAGASESARFLAGHAEWFLRFGTPGGYRPDRLLGRLGPALAAPGADVAGLHLFTFNQVQQTEQWRRAVLARGGDPPGTPRGPARLPLPPSPA
jgi:methylenetetrahydrofolate reductase (NADH)